VEVARHISQLQKCNFISFSEKSSNKVLKRTASSGISRRVVLVRTHVSEELSASFIRVTRLDEVGTTLAVTSNRRTLRRMSSYVI
jgi:hypothetical protein